MTDYKLKTPEKIENAVVGSFKSIENGVVSGYKKIEDAVVSGYKKVEENFVESFLLEEEQIAMGMSDGDNRKANFPDNEELLA